eukprot:4752500-Amphidinium_carterae.1
MLPITEGVLLTVSYPTLWPESLEPLGFPRLAASLWSRSAACIVSLQKGFVRFFCLIGRTRPTCHTATYRPLGTSSNVAYKKENHTTQIIESSTMYKQSLPESLGIYVGNAIRWHELEVLLKSSLHVCFVWPRSRCVDALPLGRLACVNLVLESPPCDHMQESQ